MELKEFIKIRNRELTNLIQDNGLSGAVKDAIKTYMKVRHETLKEHLQYLTGHLGEKEKPLTITIGAEDGTKELFTKLFEKLSTPSEYALIEPPTKLSMKVSEALNGVEASELGAEASELGAEASKLEAESEGSESEAELEGSKSEAEASEPETELKAPESEERLPITPIPMGTNTSAICVMSF